MNHVRNDQYTHLDRGCPMRTDLHPADDVVEVVLGEWRLGGTLRLVVDDPDMLLRFAETLGEARGKLIRHLRAKAHPDPAMSQVDMKWTDPVAGRSR